MVKCENLYLQYYKTIWVYYTAASYNILLLNSSNEALQYTKLLTV